ncbi:MAG: RNA polymerase sigma factor [Acidimicrobiales bacterium]|nr:RNA polymerase sigma factor [Acidimicrobiales bacterium]MCB1016927.1 RNA polymerase sigma factor [Acidimicrobiales bacterium]
MGERAERPAEPVRVTDVEALMADDGETFAVLFDRYWIDVVRFVSRRAPHDHAVDVASEVFRIAFERRLDFVPRHDTARPWLYGIASNLLRSQRRSEGRGRRAVLRLAGRAVADDDFTADIDGSLDAAAMVPALRDALLALSADDRAVLLLAEWDGLDYAEIAQLQRIPVGTARSRAHRARRQLRAALARPHPTDTEEGQR